MKRKYVVALSVLLGSATSTDAPRAADTNQTIQGLQVQCKASTDSPDLLFCAGFISGIGDLMRVNGAVINPFRKEADAPIRDERMCGQPSYGAQMQAFVNWAEKHPQLWNMPRAFGVISALSESWPCLENSN
jgi:hypothetical protein